MTVTEDAGLIADSGLIAGRYRLLSKAGSGAMGVVWLARDEVLGRNVAVKELQPATGMSSTQIEHSHLRMRREGRIAARLHHPNAVCVYDVADHDGRPYLIMEYVPSSSLAEILEMGTVLAPAEAARIGAQLASALVAAHDAGIVHRDIKPGNVLLTADGTAKLTDFGISRATGDATVTATGDILGTPAFIAPETAQGHAIGFPSDVFSLGATLYAAMEGTPPFGVDENAMVLLLRIVNDDITAPKRCGPLTDTLMWMLRHEPADRPTMRDVRLALEAVAAAATDASGSVAATEPVPVPMPMPVPVGAEVEAAAPPAPNSAAGLAEVPTEFESQPLSQSQSQSQSRARPRGRLVLALGLAVAVLVATGVVLAMRDEGHSTTRIASPGSATAPVRLTPPAAAPHTSAPPVSPSAAAPHTSAPPVSPSTASSTPPDITTQLASTISGYYSLVPGHLDQAWGSMTPDYQQNHAGGLTAYQEFWKPIQRVALSDIVPKAPSTVVATIDYFYQDGREIEERTSFGLVQVGDAWKIASTTVLSSRTL